MRTGGVRHRRFSQRTIGWRVVTALALSSPWMRSISLRTLARRRGRRMDRLVEPAALHSTRQPTTGRVRGVGLPPTVNRTRGIKTDRASFHPTQAGSAGQSGRRLGRQRPTALTTATRSFGCVNLGQHRSGSRPTRCPNLCTQLVMVRSCESTTCSDSALNTVPQGDD